jgi:ABC-2 type transport system ATP-binding protein
MENEIVLKIAGLTKTFGSKTVVDDITLETYAGEVFGFLGPNGAGKTTTIKMIMGLLRRDSGEIYINGVDTRKNFEKAMENIGGIVENPEMYNYLTGLQNLRQYKRIRSGITDERIDEVVRLVGLEKRIKEKVKRYSLGMKQRLGVAQSIMHRPKVLIFDEPTNGLDPAGIKELRDMLKGLAHEEKVGVFVSSHLLSEMQLMCDRVGIISNGKLIAVKSAAELSGDGDENGGAVYRLTVEPVEKAAELLAEAEPGKISVVSRTPQYLDVRMTEDDVNTVSALLINNGVSLRGINKQERSLEDMFIEITGGGGNQIE